MAHDVFISYSIKDKPIADAICTNLETAGVRCWIAPRDIAPGEDWPTAITRAISQSRIMVLVFSAHSNSSEDVGRELILAANSKLVIIPFKIENIEPEPGKQYYLARTHWLDAINPPTREQIHALIDCVKALIPFREPAPIETLNVDQSIPGKKPLQQSLQKPAPGKRVNWGRYLWIPVSLLLLGLIGYWVVLTFVTHNLPESLAPRTTTTGIATLMETATLASKSTTLAPVPLDWNVSVLDPFSSNLNGWPTLNNSNDGCSVSSLDIQNDALIWDLDALAENFCGYVFHPGIPPVSDFDISMDVKRGSGNGKTDFGIGFRIIDADNYFIFVISDIAQSYKIRRILNNSWSTLVDWKYNSAINSSGNNHLAVFARGSVFSFHINDTLVDSVEDSGIPSGYNGIVSELFDGGDVSISYDNFVLHGIR